MKPEYLLNVSQGLIDIYTGIETDLIDNIAKKLSKGNKLLTEIEKDGELIKITDWQVERLNELNKLNQENINLIAKKTGKTPKEVASIFNQAIDTQTRQSEATLLKGVNAGILKPANALNESQVVGILKTAGQENVLTTLNKMNNTMLRSAGQKYVEIVSNVSSKVLAGTRTPHQAMVEGVRGLSRQGITSFVANNGANWSPEAYVSMTIRADLRNTVNEIQNQRSIEFGNDYIEITAYTGARPKCAEDQGQIYSLSGNTEPITDLDGSTIYPKDWRQTSFGEPDGILGINCGHQRFDFVPGLSTHNEKDIDQKENSIEYEEKQQQRLIERQIRQYKRETSALENAKAPNEAIDKAKQKVAIKQAEMRSFIDQTNRKRNYNREKVVL